METEMTASILDNPVRLGLGLRFRDGGKSLLSLGFQVRYRPLTNIPIGLWLGLAV